MNKAEEINNRINEIINEEVQKQLKYYLGEDQLEVLNENKKLKEEIRWLKNTIAKLSDECKKADLENKKLREENELLKQCLDELMFQADVINVKINGELGEYVYVRRDKQFKLDVKD